MLTITDSRTGKQYEVPITRDTIRAMDLRQIKVAEGDFGLISYDPAFLNTASCQSRITYIDGDRGVLLYRGYPIEQLAEHSNYVETAYLILFGELPTEHPARGMDTRADPPYDAAREHEEADGGLSASRASDGDLPEHGRRDVHLVPGCQTDPLPGGSARSDRPLDREGAHHPAPTPTGTTPVVPTSPRTTT